MKRLRVPATPPPLASPAAPPPSASAPPPSVLFHRRRVFVVITTSSCLRRVFALLFFCFILLFFVCASSCGCVVVSRRRLIFSDSRRLVFELGCVVIIGFLPRTTVVVGSPVSSVFCRVRPWSSANRLYTAVVASSRRVGSSSSQLVGGSSATSVVGGSSATSSQLVGSLNLLMLRRRRWRVACLSALLRPVP